MDKLKMIFNGRPRVSSDNVIRAGIALVIFSGIGMGGGALINSLHPEWNNVFQVFSQLQGICVLALLNCFANILSRMEKLMTWLLAKETMFLDILTHKRKDLQVEEEKISGSDNFIGVGLWNRNHLKLMIF